MLRALFLSIAAVALPMASASADPPLDPASNAALKYWQAFSALPKLTDAEQTKIHDYLTTPLDDHAREVVAEAEYSLTMLHQGAAQGSCDWGVSPEEGIYVRFTQAPASRVLAALACLRARIRFEEGKSDQAVDDLVATMTLGRHVSLTGTNIMQLVGYAIENLAIETLAHDLLKLDAGLIKDLTTRLNALPRGMNTAMATETEEKFFLDWFIRKVKGAKDKETLVKALDFMNNEPERKPRGTVNKALAFIDECGGTPEGVLRVAEDTRASYKRTVTMLSQPLDQFEKQFKDEEAKHAANRVYMYFFPAVVNVRRAEARTDTRRALLRAALAVKQDGRDALKNHVDPVVGGPFEYVSLPDGFELRSRLKTQDNKPVALTVGRQKARGR
jgi:hypothetical protein